MMESTQSRSTRQRENEAVQIAREIYRQDPTWVLFFREILGVGGVIRRLFPDDADYLAFEQTPQYREIQQMLTDLRQVADAEVEKEDPIRVITVRLPSSVHEALRAEAFTHQTSMNQLCIAKLVRAIDQQILEEEGAAQPPKES